MNLVDSSAWLEYFTDGPNAGHFAGPVADTDSLVVPTVVLYEVFKVVLREQGENDALQAVAAMQKGRVVELTSQLAISAARISHDLQIPMADSVILATARAHDAAVWTQDADFEGMPEAQYVPKA